MIVNRNEMPARKIEIDLNSSGPEGNAFAIMRLVSQIAKQVGYTREEIDGIIARMMEGDYDNLVNVADEEFGDIITFYK